MTPNSWLPLCSPPAAGVSEGPVQPGYGRRSATRRLCTTPSLGPRASSGLPVLEHPWPTWCPAPGGFPWGEWWAELTESFIMTQNWLGELVGAAPGRPLCSSRGIWEAESDPGLWGPGLDPW